MAHLEYLSNEGVGRVIQLEGDSFLVGRSTECDLFIDDSRVSRRHAIIGRVGIRWTIEDLESKNGTLVNGERTRTLRLQDYDVISIGPALLRFLSGTEPPSDYRMLNQEAVTQIVTGGLLASESQRRLSLLLEIAGAIDTMESPESLLSRFKDFAFRLFQPQLVIIRFQGMEARHTARDCSVDANEIEGFMKRVEANGNPMVHKEMQEPGKPAMHMMGAPVHLSDRVAGGLFLVRSTPDDSGFVDDDLLLLIGVARLVSAAAASSARFARIDAENRMLTASSGRIGMLVGRSEATVNLKDIIETRIARVRATVLLTGETGTGKSMVARAIHLASDRAREPYVAINCAAIPRELIESELFGHEKGAFTGATARRIGLFESASGGTVFLDEIGELDTGAQAKLLNVIQDRQFKRVGGTTPIDVDVRIIAATNRDLKTEVELNQFREDLFYRLNVVNLEIPPLRERVADIPDLATHFLREACHGMGRRIMGISDEVMQALTQYAWPGNVRELSNCMERAAIFAVDGMPIQTADLPPELLATSSRIDAPLEETGEKEIILAMLAECDGNRREAARRLGWYPQKFYARLKKFGIA